MVTKCNVRTPEQALAYITDCNLATVAEMAMKKSRPKHEFERQMSIAQCAVDWMQQMHVDFQGTRAVGIVKDFKGSVADWAKTYMPEHK